MLQRIRDKSSGPMAYAIVGLIALVFSVWGIGSYFTESADPTVAEVGDRSISKYELQRAYDQRYARLQELMGENFDHDQIDPSEFRRQVLEGMIQQAMLSQYAADTGYRVTDRALLQALREDSRFQVDGSFSAERYRGLLSQAGISAARFESGLREDLKVRQIREGVLDTAFVSDRQVGAAVALRNQRRRGAYLMFEPDAFRGQVEVGDSEIEAFYENNPDAFMRPERVKLNYVLLDRNELEIADEPDEEYLRTLYEQEKESRFKSPERRMARHILVRIDDDTDADEARERIQAIQSELQADETTFAEAARENSDDGATAEQGGKLDWVSRGTMVAPFEESLFELEAGEVSSPVKTEFGWHLIKLEEIDPADIKPFDDSAVQSELMTLYRSKERKERFQQMSERLDELSFEAPQSLKPLADELGLDIRGTDWVTRDSGGSGITGEAAVREAAFSDSVIQDRLNSTPIQLSGDRLAVVRVAEHQSAKRRPLEEVRDQIRDTLVTRAAADRAQQAAEQALEAVRGGAQNLETVAGESGAELVNVDWMQRDDGQLPAPLRDRLFALPRPGEAGASYGMASTRDGRTAVLRLSGIRTPEPESGAGERMARSLRSRIAGLEFAALRQSIRDDFDVEIREDRLN